jgi:hypothetical protein
MIQQAPPRKRKWDQPVAQPPAGGISLSGTSDMIAQAQAAALAVSQQFSAVSVINVSPRVSHAAAAAPHGSLLLLCCIVGAALDPHLATSRYMHCTKHAAA